MNWVCRILGAAGLVVTGLATGGVIPIVWAVVGTSIGTAAGLFHDKPTSGSGVTLPLVFFVCGALASAAGCAHNTFETCLRTKAVSRVETRVAYALACGKNFDCLREEGISDAIAYAADAAVCRAEAVDSGRD